MTAPASLSDQEIIDAFHLLWYERRQRQTWRDTTWLGVPLQQCPCDLWVYQEIIHRTEPDVFVEVGVKNGGNTLWIASLFDMVHGNDLSRGRVVAVDITLKGVAPEVRKHPRVALIEGSSVDHGVVDRVRQNVNSARTMVLLDSDHTAPHVAAELDFFKNVVSPGCYMIVNDTNIGGHPALDWKDSSPYDAVEHFLATNEDFYADRTAEKHMLTLSPNGYLRRLGPGESAPAIDGPPST